MFINYGIFFSGISINIEDKETKPFVQRIQNIKVLTKEHEITSSARVDRCRTVILTVSCCDQRTLCTYMCITPLV